MGPGSKLLSDQRDVVDPCVDDAYPIAAAATTGEVAASTVSVFYALKALAVSGHLRRRCLLSLCVGERDHQETVAVIPLAQAALGG